MVNKKKEDAKSETESTGAVPQELRDCYQFMLENNLHSVEFSRKDHRVRMVRKGKAVTQVAVPVAGAAASGGAPAAAPAAAAPAGAAAMPANTVAIKSPMMGVFYRSPTPSSPPFVREGDVVKPGDVIALIEAMKVFNDLKSDVAGKVVRIMIENGKPVKVGQEILWVEAAA
ncbi:MAG: acetyl-CoA carboxylase, biotin carboxyl carrier protein [Elusimicrobia bacterium GWA2_69_24]|nr:MAG: acetyl-CoA carboxylase, biotin carboxyl carrier protein [Elusimicrobia bacterium GWA2_69_24]